MIAEPYWTLRESLDLIRALQPELPLLGYHLTLGGGVLNTGESKKDLDLFFLPLDNADRPAYPDKLVALLEERWGRKTSMQVQKKYVHLDNKWYEVGAEGHFVAVFAEKPKDVDYPATPDSPYLHKYKFRFSGLRIDAFILKGKVGVGEPKAMDVGAKPGKAIDAVYGTYGGIIRNTVAPQFTARVEANPVRPQQAWANFIQADANFVQNDVRQTEPTVTWTHPATPVPTTEG